MGSTPPPHSALSNPMLRYDPNQPYEWNYEHAPPVNGVPTERPDPPVPGGRWDFCDLPVASPLGMPAGPLLNGRWILYYAERGFEVLTYKTVRSRARACYPLPNLVPVSDAALDGSRAEVTSRACMGSTWAVSFGMPSREPEVWRRDVLWTRERLPKGKILSVSVVGTMEPGWNLDQLAADYARCARWAVESGAHCVEANLSCPNVSSADGQLYQQPEAAAVVTRAVREAVREVPVLLKIGHVTHPEEAEALAEAVSPFASGLSMVNCLSARVRAEDGSCLFEGQPRGIAGAAIREAVVRQVSLFSRVIRERGFPLRIVGVGGVGSAQDVRRLLESGAHAVHIATAAMLNPNLGWEIRDALSAASGTGKDLRGDGAAGRREGSLE